MATDKRYTVKLRRRRLGKTDYKVRLRLLLSKKTRLVIRRSLKNFIAQLIDYNEKGDNVLVTVSSRNLIKYGWNYHSGNLPSAYLTGLLLGIEAKKKRIKEAVLDIGLNESIKGSSIYALLKGVIDAGLLINHNKDILPSYERVSGKHIFDYALKIKNDKEFYNKQFSKYLKDNIMPEDIIKQFEQVKAKILGDKNA